MKHEHTHWGRRSAWAGVICWLAVTAWFWPGAVALAQAPVNGVTSRLADPLVCTGPGSTVQGTSVVTSGAAQNASASTALPAQLLGLAGTCTASTGNCSISNSVVNWAGALTAGQVVTIRYLAQVADDTPPNTQLCAQTTATFGNAVQPAVQGCLTLSCPPPGPGLPHNSRSAVNDQRAGSVLFYNIYTSAASGGDSQNTRISLTNTHSQLTAYVHLFYVDGSTCSVADNFICLTANQTSSFLASDIDPGTSGYLVAVATDALGCPINFNYLIGDEFVKFASGHAANLGAEAATAIAGGLPRCDPSTSTVARLNFDGFSYSRLPQVLALDNIPSRADGNDTLLILNAVAGDLAVGAAGLGSIFGIIYDDSESPFSFNLTGGCQLRLTLSNSLRIAPRFDTIIPAGRSGWMKLAAVGGNPILGAMINRNSNVAATANAFNQGHNLHKLTLQNSGLEIPIFPPSCF